ncbi:hypothetical protein D3C75_714880 [compost metagenome]
MVKVAALRAELFGIQPVACRHALLLGRLGGFCVLQLFGRHQVTQLMLVGRDRQAQVQGHAFGIGERHHHRHFRLGPGVVPGDGSEVADGQGFGDRVAAPGQRHAPLCWLEVFDPGLQGTDWQHMGLGGRRLVAAHQLGHVQLAHVPFAQGCRTGDTGGDGVGPQVRAVADPHFLGGVLAGVGPHPAGALAGQVALTAVVVLQPLVAQLLVEARADVLMNDQLFALKAFHEHVDIARAQSAEGVGRVLQRGEALFQVEACIGIAAGGGVAGAGHDGVAHWQDGHACAAGRAGGGATDGGVAHVRFLFWVECAGASSNASGGGGAARTLNRRQMPYQQRATERL